MHGVEVRDHGLVGEFYALDGAGPLPGVLVLGGSDGGVPSYTAARLAGEGFACLALAYFRADGLPRSLGMIPLEYFSAGMTWLLESASVQGPKVGVLGASKGAELALLLAATFLDQVGAVVAIAPSSVVFAGISLGPTARNNSSWSHHGRPVPFVPYRKGARSGFSTRGIAFGPMYDAALTDTRAVADAAIPIERATAPILLVSGDRDAMWPSSRMAQAVVDRLTAHGRGSQVTHLRYADAGHRLSPHSHSLRDLIGVRMLDGGGSDEANAAAGADAWARAVRFLEHALRRPTKPSPPTVRYQSTDEDSGRWLGFPFRSGDIVISTRSKSGTTWMQMICALLIFQTPDLPAPLRELSPWLDWLVNDKDEVWARLARQTHRRFIKTHTPLDGIPLHPEATYIVVARNPLDMAVSLYHQGDNLDRKRMRELSGQPEPTEPPPPRLNLHDWLVDWIERDTRPEGDMDSLPGVMHHLSDAWARRNDPNVVLVHYDDLQADLDGQMRTLAARLGIEVNESIWPALVKAATFDEMQSRADDLTPDVGGIFKNRASFFRGGRSGAGAAQLSSVEVARYDQRAGELASDDMLSWLNR